MKWLLNGGCTASQPLENESNWYLVGVGSETQFTDWRSIYEWSSWDSLFQDRTWESRTIGGMTAPITITIMLFIFFYCKFRNIFDYHIKRPMNNLGHGSLNFKWLMFFFSILLEKKPQNISVMWKTPIFRVLKKMYLNLLRTIVK